MPENTSFENLDNPCEDILRFGKLIEGLPLKTQLRLNSIGLLDNVSTQLLKLLATNSVENLINLTTISPDTLEKDAFNTLFVLFKQVKLIYTSSPLLHVDDIAPGLWLPGEHSPYILRGHETYIHCVMRKSNLITFLLSLLGLFQYGFSFLDDSFMEVFCPVANESLLEPDKTPGIQCGKLLKAQAVLYLDLKTQAFISAMESLGEGYTGIPSSKQDILDRIFPKNMKAFLCSKKGLQIAQLTPSEEDFVTRCAHRREKLLNQDNLTQLMEEYDWIEFFKELFEYTRKNLGFLIWVKKDKGMASLYSDISNGESVRGTVRNLSEKDSSSNLASTTSLTDEKASTPAKNKRKQQNGSERTDVVPKKPKQKRLWTKEEEEMLITALKEYGPSWSKILERHGAGGSISEILKNRSQVQLKDKARNWKMYFLKSGLPVPDYLNKVTGDLERDEKSKQRSRAKKKNAMKPTVVQKPDITATATYLPTTEDTTLRVQTTTATNGSGVDPQLHSN
ncbi:LAFE_0G09758g1_1 [Lachancea fermentati]|uniref:LAFE_0G09758g1_1 n=1 Tax=Lachancea fermentati TaxID=4955 RepID=A0A1G4MHN4_LACFM|nr:LAFE_0G09758g1_1 [Lachancea fermentati]